MANRDWRMLFVGMVYGVLITSWLTSGCAVPVDKTDPDVPIAQTVEAAAQRAGRTYILGLADAAEATAEKAGEFKANSEAWDDNKARNAAAHSAAFDPLAAAEDAAVKPDAPYDAAKVRQMFLDEAAGYRKAVR